MIKMKNKNAPTYRESTRIEHKKDNTEVDGYSLYPLRLP